MNNSTTLHLCQLLHKKWSFNVMKQDVICATPQTGCQHYCYENEKLARLVKNQLDEIMRIETEDKKRPKNLKKHWQMNCWKNLSLLKKTQPHCKEICLSM